MDLEERSRMFLAAVARGDGRGAREMGNATTKAIWNGSERAMGDACDHLAMIKGPVEVEEVVTRRNVTIVSWHGSVVRGLLTISWDRDGRIAFLNAQVRT